VTPPEPYTCAFEDLTIGPGTAYEIQSIEGLGLPEIRSGDVPRSLEQGETIGMDFPGGRDITLTIDMDISTIADWSNFVTYWALGTSPQEFPFWYMPPWPVFAETAPVGGMFRLRKYEPVVDQRYGLGHLSQVKMLLHSTDPRLYWPTTTTDLVWNTAVDIPNYGTYEQRPILNFQGPIVHPSVTNASILGNPWLSFDTLPTAEDYLTVDLLTHQILYQFTEPAPYWKLSTGNMWWWLNTMLDGPNQIIFWSNDESAPAGSCSITYSEGAFITVA
jgi:hypothetical protein